MTTQPITLEMKASADALLKWTGLSHFGANDVLVWWLNPARNRVGVAFRGDALKIQRHVLDSERQMMANREDPYARRGGSEYRGYLDKSMQQVLGVDVGQTMSTPDEAYSEVLRGVGTAVAAKLGGEEFHVVVTLMPNEGAPWVEGTRETEYYSAKKKKVLVNPAPGWTLPGAFKEEGEDREGLVADVCVLTPMLEPERASGEAIVGRLKGMEFFATHSFGIGRRGEPQEVIESVKRCGGLLYPSIAVGHLPASIFGPVSLFTDVRLPLLSVKPYKESRGRYPVVLYAYDVWTETTRHFLGTFARELFLQLTGNDGEMVGYMAVLGPTLGGLGGPGSSDDGASAVVQTTSKLASLLARRMKIWNEKADTKRTTETHWDQADRYPYLEAKVHARLPLGVFRLATAPEPLKEEALAFLRAIGYHGPLALVQMGSVKLEDLTERLDDQAIFQYAWNVRRAVLEYASKNPRATVEILT